MFYSQRKIVRVQYMFSVKFKCKLHIYVYTYINAFMYISINIDDILLIRICGYVEFPIL